MSSTRVRRHVEAPRARVYRALIDADSVAKWKFPDDMTIHLHAFEGRENEFVTSDPALRGEMTTTITLTDAEDGGTDLLAVHDGLPPGVSPADNEAGWEMALARLAALVESQ